MFPGRDVRIALTLVVLRRQKIFRMKITVHVKRLVETLNLLFWVCLVLIFMFFVNHQVISQVRRDLPGEIQQGARRLIPGEGGPEDQETLRTRHFFPATQSEHQPFSCLVRIFLFCSV